MFMTNHAPGERNRRYSIVAQLLIMLFNHDPAEAQSARRCWSYGHDRGYAVTTQVPGSWLCWRDLVEA